MASERVQRRIDRILGHWGRGGRPSKLDRLAVRCRMLSGWLAGGRRL